MTLISYQPRVRIPTWPEWVMELVKEAFVASDMPDHAAFTKYHYQWNAVDDELILTLDLPGISKEGVKVEVDVNKDVIHVVKMEESTHYTLQTVSAKGIKAYKMISATMADGQLTVTFTKKEKDTYHMFVT